MSRFTDKASSRIDRMSDEQIVRLIENQNNELLLRDCVLDSIHTGLLLADKSFHVLYVNKYLYRLLPCMTFKNHIGIESFIDNKDVLDFICSCIEKNLIGKELFYNYDSAFDGQLFIKIISISVPDTEYMVFRFDDYTFLNHLRQEFKKNESLAAMTTMAAGVAHEIKNPLTSISIYLQLLQRKLNKDGIISKKEAEQSLIIISEEIERLNKIAVDFLFAVKPLNVNQLITDLNPVVDKTMAICEVEATKLNVKIILEKGTSLPKIFIDCELIEQCLLNLIRNALQAFDKQKNKTIVVKTFLDGDVVKLSVSDNACGMTQEQMSRIFEPYYTTKAQGTGLGLTTIFKIMKSHDGEISVDSKEGQGSVFTLQFPVPQSERFRVEQK